jgi:hypothetical protein
MKNFKKLATFGAALVVIALGVWACQKYGGIDPSAKSKSKEFGSLPENADLYTFSNEEFKAGRTPVPLSVTSSTTQEYNFRVAVDSLVRVSITRSNDTAFVTTQAYFTSSTSAFYGAVFLTRGFTVTDLADTLNNLKAVSFAYSESNGKIWLIQVLRTPNVAPMKNSLVNMDGTKDILIACACDAITSLVADIARPCAPEEDTNGWLTCKRKYCEGCCLTFVKQAPAPVSSYRKSGLLGIYANVLVFNGTLYQ